MHPLFSFLLGAAATTLLTTDSGRKLADRMGEIARTAVQEKCDEAMAALKPKDGGTVEGEAVEKEKRDE